MTNGNGNGKARQSQAFRCAIYTRVSTPEQAAGDFSSIDNQREMAEAYVKSQASKGWVALEGRYDDRGCSGGTLERPALERLLQDVRAGRIDCIVVSKIDRLSRSLLDFARLVDVLNSHGVGFVSVTQQFDTSTSMGTLVLNILFSFAQFEREMVAERTQEKIVAARKRGRWTGGPVPLGYDLAADGGGLVPNKAEAERVRAIYRLYSERESLTATLAELRKRRWQTKSWTMKNGDRHEGVPFQKASLRRLLTNPLYRGKVLCKGKVYDGLHEPIIDRALWDRVQHLLEANGSNGGGRVKNKHGALLKGILRCASCGTPMRHSFTRTNGRQYRYYRCDGSPKHGSDPCPTKSIPAAEIERVIVERIQAIGKDRELIRETIQAAREQLDRDLKLVLADIKTAERDLSQLRREEKRVLPVIGKGGTAAERATERLEELARASEGLQERLKSLSGQAAALREQIIKPGDLKAALASFREIWDVLLPRERARIVGLLIQQVDYNGETGTLGITFHPVGIKALVAETASDSEGAK